MKQVKGYVEPSLVERFRRGGINFLTISRLRGEGFENPVTLSPVEAQATGPEKCRAESLRHREMFAAAYLKATNIPPEEAILVEQRTEKGFEWFFKRREAPDHKAMYKETLGMVRYLHKTPTQQIEWEKVSEFLSKHTPASGKPAQRSLAGKPSGEGKK